MNSAERVMAAIKGEPTDRVPVTAVLCMYGARLIGCELKEYYTNPEKYELGQIAVVEKFGPDILLSPLCVANEAKAFGCEIKYFEKNPPNISKRAIASYKEIKSLKFPDIEKNPHLLYVRETVRRISKKYHGHIPLAAVWMDPLDMLANAIGPETFMELMIFHRSEFDEVMEQMIEFCINYGNALLLDGADILINFASLCNTAMITREMAENIAKPILEKTYSKINGGILFHHGGAGIASFIDVYKTLPNILGFVIDSRDNLLNGREAAGENLIIAGNIEGPTMDIRSPEQITIICNKMLASMETDRHFILCSSAADVPYSTAEENIHALIRAPRLFKRM